MSEGGQGSSWFEVELEAGGVGNDYFFVDLETTGVTPPPGPQPGGGAGDSGGSGGSAGPSFWGVFPRALRKLRRQKDESTPVRASVDVWVRGHREVVATASAEVRGLKQTAATADLSVRGSRTVEADMLAQELEHLQRLAREDEELLLIV